MFVLFLFVESTAFLICIRLAFTQARLWELTDETRRYEAPPEIESEEVDLLSVFQTTADEFAHKGHDITEASQGKQSGHYCCRCTTFHAKHNFNKWLTGKPCKPKATCKEIQTAFEENFNFKAKAARVEREALVIIESDEETEKKPEPPKPSRKLRKPLGWIRKRRTK